MTTRLRNAVRGLLALLCALVLSSARAHSASDAYLTLTANGDSFKGETVVRGQWDIALRDLDFLLTLDANGDGNITWAELRAQQSTIERYAYARLSARAEGRMCTLRPVRQQVDNHADGAYAALTFDIACAGKPARLALDYSLLFALDPSHRCILVFQSGSDTATAVLSPTHATVDLPLTHR
jgi:hypothetical protein